MDDQHPLIIALNNLEKTISQVESLSSVAACKQPELVALKEECNKQKDIELMILAKKLTNSADNDASVYPYTIIEYSLYLELQKYIHLQHK